MFNVAPHRLCWHVRLDTKWKINNTNGRMNVRRVEMVNRKWVFAIEMKRNHKLCEWVSSFVSHSTCCRFLRSETICKMLHTVNGTTNWESKSKHFCSRCFSHIRVFCSLFIFGNLHKKDQTHTTDDTIPYVPSLYFSRFHSFPFGSRFSRTIYM